MKKEDLEKHWENITDFKEIENRGICGIMKLAFTYGITHNIEEGYFGGRWCFKTYEEAEISFKYWDGKGDPLGHWVKYKGEIEYSNINNPNFNRKFDKPNPKLKNDKSV